MGLEEWAPEAEARRQLRRRSRFRAIEHLPHAHGALRYPFHIHEAKTWVWLWQAMLMRALLDGLGDWQDVGAARELLADEFGRETGRVALVELSPLPAPGIGKWPWRNKLRRSVAGAWRLARNRSRRRFIQHALLENLIDGQTRAERIRSLVTDQTRWIICYGQGWYREHYQEVLNPLWPDGEPGWTPLLNAAGHAISAGRKPQPVLFRQRGPMRALLLPFLSDPVSRRGLTMDVAAEILAAPLMVAEA